MLVRHIRGIFILGVVVALTIAGPTAAFAAAPSNDLKSGATAVTSLPFSQSLDTTQATTDSDDTAVNANCGAPATEASVWYTYTSPDPISVIVDVSKSDYSSGVIVYDETGGYLATCGPGSVFFDANPGDNYSILAFDDTPGGTNGGNLQIDFSEAPPPPTLTVTLDPSGRVNGKTGVATLSGTFTCSGQVDYMEIDGSIQQRAGRVVLNGFFYDAPDPSLCDGATHTWSGSTDPSSGKFAGGKATVSIDFFACGFQCSDAFVSKTVNLKGK